MTLPKVIVFDLDYTLWPCWCDTHISPPIKPYTKTSVKDKYGYELSFYPDVPQILSYLRDKDVKIVAASRTCAPQVAKKLLNLLHIDDKSAITMFDHLEWGTFSKKNHITQAIKHMKNQGIINDDVQMHHVVLFDDELRNKDVESMGCLMIHIPNEKYGLTKEIFDKGMQKYKEKLDIWEKVEAVDL